MDVSQPQRAYSFNPDFMDLMLDTAWPDGFKREFETNFGQRSISFQTGIKHLDSSAWTPATVRGGASDRVTTSPGDTPNCCIDRRWLHSIESIKNRSIMNATGSSHGSGVRRLIEALDDRQNLVGASRMNEVDGALAIEQAVL